MREQRLYRGDDLIDSFQGSTPVCNRMAIMEIMKIMTIMKR